jgi:hypothetical protein
MFSILPGWYALASAFNFSVDLVTIGDPPNTAKGMQAACLYKVLLQPEDLGIRKEDDCSGGIVVIPKEYNKILVEGPIILDCCDMSLSANNTIMRIDNPGIYRFVLNEDTAVKDVQVYLQSYVQEKR